jgi:hypothetical protein
MDTSPDSFASDLFYGFDIQDVESLDFLRSLITSGTAPADEVRKLWRVALLRGHEEWDMTFACAASLHARSIRDRAPEGNPGFLAYLTFVCAGDEEREEFLAKRNLKGGAKKQKQKEQRAPKRVASRFWEDGKAMEKKVRGSRRTKEEASVKWNSHVQDEHLHAPVQQTTDPTSTLETIFKIPGHTPEVKQSPSYSPLTSPSLSPSPSPQPSSWPVHNRCLTPRSRAYKSSPFFTTTPTSKKPRRKSSAVSIPDFISL